MHYEKARVPCRIAFQLWKQRTKESSTIYGAGRNLMYDDAASAEVERTWDLKPTLRTDSPAGSFVCAALNRGN